MLPLTTQIASELDVLYGLYQLAIDFTTNIQPDDEKNMVKWLDTRQRILGRTSVAAKSATQLLKKFDILQHVPANEKALIQEKKNLVKDMLGRMQQAEFTIMKKMHGKMRELRGELVAISRKNKAAKAYQNAPRATMLVS